MILVPSLCIRRYWGMMWKKNAPQSLEVNQATDGRIIQGAEEDQIPLGFSTLDCCKSIPQTPDLAKDVRTSTHVFATKSLN